MMRNLGIVASYEIVQDVSKIADYEYAWPIDQEPESHEDLKLYKGKYIKLNLRCAGRSTARPAARPTPQRRTACVS